jgi:hypothetical protein
MPDFRILDNITRRAKPIKIIGDPDNQLELYCNNLRRNYSLFRKRRWKERKKPQNMRHQEVFLTVSKHILKRSNFKHTYNTKLHSQLQYITLTLTTPNSNDT